MVCLTRGTVQGASSVSSAPQFAMILSSGSLQDLALLFWCQREVKQPGFNICSLYNSLYSFKRFPWLIQSGDRTTLAKVLLVQTCTSGYKIKVQSILSTHTILAAVQSRWVTSKVTLERVNVYMRNTAAESPSAKRPRFCINSDACTCMAASHVKLYCTFFERLFPRWSRWFD